MDYAQLSDGFHFCVIALSSSLSVCVTLSLPLSIFYYPSIHPGALQIEMSEESDQGKYECVATNSDGTRYSTPANLYVRGKRGIKTRLSCEHHSPIRVLRFKDHIVNVWADWDLEAFYFSCFCLTSSARNVRLSY